MTKETAKIKLAMNRARTLVQTLESDLEKALAAEADPAAIGSYAPGWSQRLRDELPRARQEADQLLGRYMRSLTG